MIYVFCLAVILASLGAISYLISVRVSKQKKKEIEAVFAQLQLDQPDFYKTHFKTQGIPFFVVEKIRNVFEQELDANFREYFDEEFIGLNPSFFWKFDSLADVAILMRLEEEFDVKFSDAEATNFYRSIEGIVNLVWQKVNEKNEFPN